MVTFNVERLKDKPYFNNDGWWVCPSNFVEEVSNDFKGKSVTIHDVTLRDGEQTFGVAFSPDERVRIAEALDGISVPRVEVGMPPASPEILEGIKAGGAFLLNSPWSLEEMEVELPPPMKREIARKKLAFYNIDAVKIASELGLGGRINMIMQAAFFQIAKVIPPEDAFKYVKDAIKKTYGKKGDKVVQMNVDAVDRAVGALNKIRVPKAWATAGHEAYVHEDEPEFVTKVMRPMLTSREISSLSAPLVPTASFPRGPPSTKRGASPSTCRNGSRRTVFSAINALLSAHMP